VEIRGDSEEVTIRDSEEVTIRDSEGVTIRDSEEVTIRGSEDVMIRGGSEVDGMALKVEVDAGVELEVDALEDRAWA